MNSSCEGDYRVLYEFDVKRDLPAPRHPSLRFERKGQYWSVRITRGWRALGRMHEGTLYWFWIGAHDEYQRLLKK